jgi:hypothetical protein
MPPAASSDDDFDTTGRPANAGPAEPLTRAIVRSEVSSGANFGGLFPGRGSQSAASPPWRFPSAYSSPSQPLPFRVAIMPQKLPFVKCSSRKRQGAVRAFPRLLISCPPAGKLPRRDFQNLPDVDARRVGDAVVPRQIRIAYAVAQRDAEQIVARLHHVGFTSRGWDRGARRGDL